MNQKNTQAQKTSHSYKYGDSGKLKQLSALAAQHMDQIYEYFGIKAGYRNEMLIKSCCPIHGGDNPTALNMYYNGDYKVHYKCRTHQCEELFGNSLIHFIRGCLSRFKYSWEKEGDKEARFSEAVEFMGFLRLLVFGVFGIFGILGIMGFLEFMGCLELLELRAI